MPGFDRTGPTGAGPMTGGRRGLCGDNTYSRDIPAYGYGRGRGLKRGFRGGYGAGGQRCRRRFFAPGPITRYDYPMSKKDEMEMLKADAEAMNRSLEAVQKRIDELNQETSQQ